MNISKNRPRLGLDVDGVIANFYVAMCMKFDRPYSYISDWDVDWIYKEFPHIAGNEDFWREEIPMMNPPEVLKGLNIVAYISSLPVKMSSARLDWLRSNGYPEAPFHVCEGDTKWEICKKLDIDYFVDDRPKTCSEFHVNSDKHDTKIIQYIPEFMEYDYNIQELPWHTVTNFIQVRNLIN